MAPSYDCVASSLLCPEENNSIMGFGDDGVGEGFEGNGESLVNDKEKSFCADSLMGYQLQSEEWLGSMMERECQFLPRVDYVERLKSGTLDLSARKDAVDWIGKVRAYYSFGPLCAYLSVNYLDRFLSTYELPKGKAWMMQLLSVACLSLAAKMEETDVPLSLDLQVGDSKFIFEARTIQRMELLVLSTLKWRMQTITPFSFIDCFLQRISDGKLPPGSSISQSIELVVSTIKGIEFLEFRPSEIALAVAISVLGEAQTVDVGKAIACDVHVEKERVLQCLELIQVMGLINNNNNNNNNKPVKCLNGPVSSVPQSPNGVLDAACLSYKSDEITVGSCTNAQTSPASKRRKLNR